MQREEEAFMMRRFVAVGLLCAGCCAAYWASGVRAGVAAQQVPHPAEPGSKAERGKGVYFSVDEIKKKFANPGQTTIFEDADYRFAVQTRTYHEPMKMTGTSKTLSHWDDADMHETYTQFLFVVSGTGTAYVGGKPEKMGEARNSTRLGGPTLVGAASYHVKAGDWIVAPPTAWHMINADPGQTVIYGLLNVNPPKAQ
jgi:mannose-6-phosphate isomerase-like protein (cupin superfamily)